MAYCRGAVYMYATPGGYICQGCSIGTNVSTPSRSVMLEHMQAHREKGHPVDDAIARLKREIEEE